jgi:hypothetical protein
MHIPKKRKSSYVEQYGLRIEPELKRELDTLKLENRDDDVNEAIRIFLRELVAKAKQATPPDAA